MSKLQNCRLLFDDCERETMTPSQRATIGVEIEKRLAPAAKERQILKPKSVVAKLRQQNDNGKTLDTGARNDTTCATIAQVAGKRREKLGLNLCGRR